MQYVFVYMCIWQNNRCTYLEYRREGFIYIIVIMMNMCIYSFVHASLANKNLDCSNFCSFGKISIWRL